MHSSSRIMNHDTIRWTHVSFHMIPMYNHSNPIFTRLQCHIAFTCFVIHSLERLLVLNRALHARFIRNFLFFCAPMRQVHHFLALAPLGGLSVSPTQKRRDFNDILKFLLAPSWSRKYENEWTWTLCHHSFPFYSRTEQYLSLSTAEWSRIICSWSTCILLNKPLPISEKNPQNR